MREANISRSLSTIILAVLICCGSFSSCLAKEERVIRLTSLEWKPYTGPDLVKKGFSAAVVEAAYAAMGYKVEIAFFPWKRAVYNAQHEAEYDGYFPEYYSPEIAENFVFSESFGMGPLGVITLKENEVQWENLEDLKKFKIGVVNGYMNTAEFDRMMEDGELNVQKAGDDLSNIKKLGEKRIDLALIDEHVFEYLINYEPSVRLFKGKIIFQKVLENKKLFICFKKSPQGEEARKIFNQGIKKINVDDIINSNKFAQATISANQISD